MSDLLINLLASIIAGTAVWLAQRFLRYRRIAEQRAFFGLTDSASCQLSVARHYSSPHKLSVHRRDVAALVELATLARECGVRADLASEEELAREFGRLTEFCVGGPSGNPRTATHLRTLVPGVTYEDGGPRPAQILIGKESYLREIGRSEYVVLARVFGPDGGRPVFLLGGQTAPTNLAAARYLDRRHRALFRAYGANKPFCLLLRIVEADTYGIDYTELVGDVTDQAFARG